MMRLTRRSFTAHLLSVGAWPLSRHREMVPDPVFLQNGGGLTDVAGIKVGHFTHPRRPTGCTVVLVEEGAVAGVDVRGSAPGTHETDLLHPINTVQMVQAVVLCGGSAFGLEAVAGVMQYLEEKRIGFDVGVARVPIVPAAVLFDLGVGDARIRPDKEAGYRACQAASPGPVAQGNVGAGAGATVGKMFGLSRAMKGGIGTASIRVGDVVVAALVAVNALGDVLDPRTGTLLAGARGADGTRLVNTLEVLKRGIEPSPGRFGENTTIGVVATNAAFDKAGMTKIAQMSQDGLARAINPVHTPFDGDTLFALSTARVKGASVGVVGALAADVVAEAVVRAIKNAEGLPGIPAYRDLVSR
jgi:L-aminopeptidase/D-esterase-like protein